MDTDYQDLATATEVLNKAYQLKQVHKKWYWPLKSYIDRWKVILTALAVWRHPAHITRQWAERVLTVIYDG